MSKRKLIVSVVFTICVVVAGVRAMAQTYSNAVMGLNPVGYWPLNETSQPPQALNMTAQNLGTLGAAGNGYYGAWYQPSGNTWYITNNAVQTTGVTVDGDTAMNCTFTPGQYIILPRNTNGVANSALTLVPPFSIEAWVKVQTIAARAGYIVCEGQNALNTAGSDTNNPFYGGLGTGWAGCEVAQYSNYFVFDCFETNGLSKANELDSPKNLTVGPWIHLVVTFDGSTETMYENGVQVNQKSVASNGAGLRYVPDPTSPLMIGAGADASVNGGVAHTGPIDEVAIYNYLLPVSSMQAHYQTAYGTNATYGTNYSAAVLADSPLIYFRMDDAPGQMNVGYPSSTFPTATNYGSLGAAGDGVYQPGTTPGVAGPGYGGFGNDSRSVAINGWFGAVDIGSGSLPAALNPVGTVPMTVVSWFKTGPADSPGRLQNILGHGDNSYRLTLGQLAAENHFNPGPGPELQFTNASDMITNGFALNDGQWHMVAGISDGTNEYLYLDGILAKSASNSSGINIVGNSTDLLLGGDPQHTAASYNTGSTIRNFDGEIAQVAYFTNALSAAQIQELYNAAGVPLSIVRQPESATFDSGSDATLTVVTRGSLPGYQWYSTNITSGLVSAVAGQTNATFSFNPANQSENGYYFVVATNAYNAVTSDVVQLTIVGPPSVVNTSPNTLHVFVGTSPTLHVSVIAPSPYFQWYSNGVAIAGATNSSFVTNSSYAMTNNDTSSTGTFTYSCIVTNSFGSATDTFAVTVLTDPTAPYPAAVLTDKPTCYYRLDEADTGYPNNGVIAYDYAGGENGSYSNSTLGQPGYSSATDPAETSATFGNGSSQDSYMGNVSSYLDFTAANGVNAEFSVEAWVSASFGQLYDAGIVTIGYGFGGEQFCLDCGANETTHPLRFYVNSANGTTYKINTSYVLSDHPGFHHVVAVCDEAGGNLNLYIDGALIGTTAIPSGAGLKAETSPLAVGSRLSTATAAHYDNQFFGNIDDVALYNYALSSVQIQSHYFSSGIVPLITQVAPQSWTTNEGSTVNFTVTASGTQPLTYQWYDPSSTAIPYGTNASLALTNVQTTQSGQYSVAVANFYGTATTNVSLTVNSGPAVITTDLTPINQTVYVGSSVTYSIVVSGTPPFYYQWYQDGGAVFGATNSSYTFNALLGTHTYYCTVTNALSAGTPATSSTGTVVGMPVTTLNPSNYTDRLKITLAGYNRGETLQDFPVLVKLSTNISGFNYAHFASQTGGDLRFTDSSGTRVIPHEIDEWNSSGTSLVWVQMPALSGTNDVIWAYWGNSSDTTAPVGTNVWVPPSWQGVPPFDVVYHLKESGFPYADSTSQFTCTNGIAPTPTNGVVGIGGSFTRTPYLDAGSINIGNGFTLSAWVNPSTTPSDIQAVWANGPGGYNSAGVRFYVNSYQTADGALILATGDGSAGTQLSTGAGAVKLGGWHYVTAAVDRNSATAWLYVDGNFVTSGGTVSDFPTNSDVTLARFADTFALQGMMDEARIRSGVSSSNWVWASYMTVAQNSTFQTYSNVISTVINPVTIQFQNSGGNLIMDGSGGLVEAGAEYRVLSSTNVTLPMAQWTPVTTNNFDGSGNFSNAVPINSTNKSLFFRIAVP